MTSPLTAAQLTDLVKDIISLRSDIDTFEGSDWRGVDLRGYVHPDDSDTFCGIQFIGCNFAGCDLTLFRQDNRFTDCDLTGAYVVMNGRRQPAELDEDDNLL